MNDKSQLPTEAELLAAARRVVGERPLECATDPETDEIALSVMVKVVKQPSQPGELAYEHAQREGLECDIGDELLFPIYYLAKDAMLSRGQASFSALLGLPQDVYDAMRRELAPAGLLDVNANADANANVDDESESDLWRDLAQWALSNPPYPSDPTDEQLELALDEAMQKVPGLTTPAAWLSAARYFEAEGLRSLQGPAMGRAFDLEDELAAKNKG